MNRSEYYRHLMELAQQQRTLFGIKGSRVLKSDLRKMFKHYEVQVDLWPMPGLMPRKSLKNLRGAYLGKLECGPCVMISRDLPDEPQIFTMAHELKHHLTDQELITTFCHETNTSDVLEIGAEVFAAELIYPQQLFIDDMTGMGVECGKCEPRHLVDLKRQTKTTMHYASLAKRAAFLGYAPADSFKGIQWKKLEESIYGEPIYKRINRYRRSQSFSS
jgi:hypothetical protein